ncbi:MAG TPA: PDDEXK nuclease domain-containing protein [Polyangiaceae bacterium]|nr:PDDEXK nuclease domain-containing protein [Polyangiaceae bacterium]
MRYGVQAWVERKRIVVDDDDYYIDLLFFHRRMRRLVAIELKLGDFKPADSGQVELYLRWLDRHERQPTEEAPLGIILCAGKKRETVEYLDLDARGIHVAEYLTELPPREVLQERLHRAIAIARDRLTLVAATDDEDGATKIGTPSQSKPATSKTNSKSVFPAPRSARRNWPRIYCSTSKARRWTTNALSGTSRSR